MVNFDDSSIEIIEFLLTGAIFFVYHSLSVFPSLNSDHEEITLGKSNIDVSPNLDIKTTINKDGVEANGNDKISNYLRVLQSLVYINRKPAYYLNRVFKISCGILDDKFHTSELTLTLTVLRPEQPAFTDAPPSTTEKPAAASQDHANLFNHVLMHQQEASEPHAKITHNTKNLHGGATHPTMLIVVICSMFVLLIVFVGIARLRNQKHVQSDKKSSTSKVNIVTL
jgi:calsyntenin 1